jgi:hypothetical protein
MPAAIPNHNFWTDDLVLDRSLRRGHVVTLGALTDLAALKRSCKVPAVNSTSPGLGGICWDWL